MRDAVEGTAKAGSDGEKGSGAYTLNEKSEAVGNKKLDPYRAQGMGEKVGDDAWWLHHVVGPWDMAAEVRGLVDLSMDVYDRPQFVHDLMRFCTDWLKGFYRRLG